MWSWYCLQDKVIFHRLEAVSLVVEKGEWPQLRRYYSSVGYSDALSADSQSSTPLPGTPQGTPRGDPAGHDYNLLSTPEGMVRAYKVKRAFGLNESEADELGYHGDEYYHGDDPYPDCERDFKVAMTEVWAWGGRVRVCSVSVPYNCHVASRCHLHLYFASSMPSSAPSLSSAHSTQW